MSDKKLRAPRDKPTQEARVIAAQARIEAASDAWEAANIEPGGSRGS